MSLRPFQPRLLMSVNLLRTAERPHSLRFLPGHSHTLEVWERLLYNCVCHGVWNAIWPLHLPSDRAERQMSSHTVKLTVVDNVTGGSPIPASWSLCKRVKENSSPGCKITQIYLYLSPENDFLHAFVRRMIPPTHYYDTFKIAAKRRLFFLIIWFAVLNWLREESSLSYPGKTP